MSPHCMLAQFDTLNYLERFEKTNRSTGLQLTESAASCSFWSASRFMRPVPRRLIVAVAMICEYSVNVFDLDMISRMRLVPRIT